MEDKFRYEGKWWLPENSGKKIEGKLEYDGENHPTLQLKNSFFQNGSTQILGMIDKFVPILFGETQEKYLITLYHCTILPGISGFGEDSGDEIFPVFVFKGGHFSPREKIFKAIIGDFSHIGKFLNCGITSPSYQEDEIKINYRKLKPFEISIDNGVRIIIKKEPVYFQRYENIPVQGIEEKTFVELNFSESKNYEDCYHQLNLLQTFLSFLIGEPIYPLSTRLKTKNKMQENEIEVFYKIPKRENLKLKKDLWRQILSSPDKIKIFLKNWINKAEILEPVYNLYVKVLDTSKPFSVDDFITLIIALEIYHRRVYDGKYVEDENFKEIRKRIEKSIPTNISKDFKDAIKNRIEYLNEFSLRKRLKNLFKKYENILKNFIKNKDAFIDCVCNTRNYFVHYDKNYKNVATGEKLYWLFTAVKILVEICFLTNLGEYKEEDIKIILHSRYSYAFAKIKTFFLS